MIKDKITVSSKEGQSFDKLQIALAIKNSTYEDELSCSLLENGVMKECSHCNFKEICEGIEAVSKDYYDRTTKVVGSFKF